MKRTIILLLGLAAIGLLASCTDDELDIDIESSIPVRVEPVVLKPIMEFAFATGTVDASNEAVLKAQQSGFYQLQTNPRTGAPFAMSDHVRQGDVIIILVNPEFENQVAYDSKKLAFESAQREFEKQKGLYDKGGITLRELTESERAFIDARYSYDNAKLQLAKLHIVAPFDGVLTDLPFFSPNQTVEIGSLLAQVMDYSKLHAEITLPGKEMDRLKRGQKALVTNYSNPLDTLEGVVTQLSPALDPGSRTFKLSLDIANDSLVLKPGMFVKVDIIVKQRDSALVVPKDVILDRRGSKTVFIVEKGIAVERSLELGLSNRLEAEVLSGLEKDERLVVEGFETLRHRSKVKVTK